MKKLIVLSGNSPRNQAWGEGAAAHFSDWFDETYLQYYDHWERGSKDMDVEAELAKLEKEVVDSDATHYVLAKSIGSLLTLLAVKRVFLQPKQCVLFGMPLELAAEELFKDDWSALAEFKVPTIAFHNDNDPISYDYTKTALAEHDSNIRLITLVGDNHDYLDFADYETEIKSFLDL